MVTPASLINKDGIQFPNMSYTYTWNRNDAVNIYIYAYFGNDGQGTGFTHDYYYGPSGASPGTSATLAISGTASDMWRNMMGNYFSFWSTNGTNTIGDTYDDYLVKFPEIAISASSSTGLIEGSINYTIQPNPVYSGYDVKVYVMKNVYFRSDDVEYTRAVEALGYSPSVTVDDMLVFEKVIATNTTSLTGTFSFTADELQKIYQTYSGQSAQIQLVLSPRYNGQLAGRHQYYQDSDQVYHHVFYEHGGWYSAPYDPWTDEGEMRYYGGAETCIYKILTLTKNVPTFTTYNYADTNTATTSVTGNNQYLVQNKSHLIVTIPVANKAVVQSSGSMSYYQVTFNGVTKTANWSSTADVTIDMGYPSSSGVNTLTVSAYDTYGLHKDVSKSVTCLSYSDYSWVNFSAQRQDGYGDSTTITISGTYSPIQVEGVTKNSIVTFSYRYISYDDDTPTWTAPTDLLPTTTQNTNGSYAVSPFVLILDKTKTYQVEITRHDKLGNPTAVINKTISIGTPIFFIDAGKMSLGFNSIPSNTKVLDMGGNDIVNANDIDTDSLTSSGAITSNSSLTAIDATPNGSWASLSKTGLYVTDGNLTGEMFPDRVTFTAGSATGYLTAASFRLDDGTNTTTVNTGSISSSGEIKSNTGVTSANYQNLNANVAINFDSNQVARIRYGGSGSGANNGFQIQGSSDIVKFAISEASNVSVMGTDFTLGSAATGRGNGGRALVQGANNTLVINYASDFGGGTDINSKVYLQNGIELAHPSSTPFIDFHNSTDPHEATDFKIRLILGSDGHLAVDSQSTANTCKISYSDLNVNSQGTYGSTSSLGANMVITSDGWFHRSTSATKYKENIEYNVTGDYAERILSLNPASWHDKAEDELFAKILENGGQLPEGKYGDPYIQRYYGLIAEDVEKVGLSEFVTYGAPDDLGHREIEGIEYSRLWTLLIPIINNMKSYYDSQIVSLQGQLDIVNDIKDQIIFKNSYLEQRIIALENS